MNVPYRLNVTREFGSIYLAIVLEVNSVVNAEQRSCRFRFRSHFIARIPTSPTTIVHGKLRRPEAD
jgi:hypothetical protein